MSLLEKRETFYVTGELRTREFYQNGQREGECTIWFPEGHYCKREFYRNGKLDGNRKIWDENGHLWIDEFFREGKREGRRMEWNNNILPANLSFYRDGRVEGEHIIWRHDGPLHSHTYQKGKFICAFNSKKRRAIIRFKKFLRFRYVVPAVSIYTISDLSKIIY